MSIDHWITAVISLRQARRVVVFTGAGVSAESGIPTFRDDGGFWQTFPPEQFASWSGLREVALSRPRQLAEFLRDVIEPIARAVPNPAHLAIAQLADHVDTTVVTQNVDGLHQAAGSITVHEIHGSLLEVVQTPSGKIVQRLTREELQQISDHLDRYARGEASLISLGWQLSRVFPLGRYDQYRPNVVLFGDALTEPAWTLANAAVDACDLLLMIGTSTAVYPAALLPQQAMEAGARVITIDPQPGIGCWLEGTAADIAPRLLHDAFPPPRSDARP